MSALWSKNAFKWLKLSCGFRQCVSKPKAVKWVLFCVIHFLHRKLVASLGFFFFYTGKRDQIYWVFKNNDAIGKERMFAVLLWSLVWGSVDVAMSDFLGRARNGEERILSASQLTFSRLTCHVVIAEWVRLLFRAQEQRKQILSIPESLLSLQDLIPNGWFILHVFLVKIIHFLVLFLLPKYCSLKCVSLKDVCRSQLSIPLRRASTHYFSWSHPVNPHGTILTVCLLF